MVRPTRRHAGSEVSHSRSSGSQGVGSVVNRSRLRSCGDRAGSRRWAPGESAGVGPGLWLGVGTWALPLRAPGSARPLSPARGLSAGGGPQAPARPLFRGRAPPATLAAPGDHRCGGVPGPSPCRRCIPAIGRFSAAPEWTLPRGLGGGTPGFQADVSCPLPRGARGRCPPCPSCHRRCRLPTCAPQRLASPDPGGTFLLLEVSACASSPSSSL